MENKGILVDTSILIDHFRKRDKNKTVLVSISKNYSIAISTITRFEFLIGFKNINSEFISLFLKNISILPFDEKCSDIAIEVYNDLRRSNKIIPAMDILIASIAISNDLPIATLNKEHFERIKGLELLKIG